MRIFLYNKIPPNNIRRVLLIRRKALGDCLVTLPAVRELSLAFPEAELHMIIDKPFAHIISLLVPGVTIIPWSANLNRGFLAGLSWYRKLWSNQYDLVVDWLGNPRTALWTAATGAPLRVGYDLPRRGWAYNIPVPRNQHSNTPLRGFAGEAFLDPLRAIGLTPVPWLPQGNTREKITIPTNDLGTTYLTWRKKQLENESRNIALMMSATWPAKAWPITQIKALVELLIEKGERPFFVPGPGDGEMVKALKTNLPESVFAPDTNLPELADLLSNCIAFAGTDCGGRHLAAAMGLPTVTVFGPTDSEGWNPSNPRHVSITNDVECLGCNHKICPLPDHPCLDGLTASQVMSGLEQVLPEFAGDE